jgi:hypothetical protein
VIEAMKEKSWCLTALGFAALAAVFWSLSAYRVQGGMAHLPSEAWRSIMRYRLWIALFYAIAALAAVIALVIRLRWIREEAANRNGPVPPQRSLVVCSAIVASSTLLLPAVTGYGSILYQWIVFGSLHLVAWLLSPALAQPSDVPFWIVAGLVNVAVFFLPAGFIWAAASRRWPRGSVALLLAWTLFYLLCLFMLFPATDGP